MAKKRKKSIWASKEEREAHEARVERTIRRQTKLAEKAWAELEKKNPELRNL